MTQKLWLLILLSIVFSFSQVGYAQTLTLVNSDWAPYKGQDLPRGGIVTDIATQALKRAGYDVNTVSAPWKRALKGSYEGVYDIVPGVWYNESRAEKLKFSIPLLTSRIVIVSKVDEAFEYETMQSLAGRMVGVGAGWAYPKAFEKADFIAKEEAVNLEVNVRKLIRGRVELIAGEEIAIRYTASKKFPNQASTLYYSQNSMQENEMHITVSKKHPDHNEIVSRFNQAVLEMQIDGTYKSILEFHGVEGVKVPK